jgi:hypothetical protein
VRRLLREDGAGETPQALSAPRRLPEPPAESEAPGEEINLAIVTEKKQKHPRNLGAFTINFSMFAGPFLVHNHVERNKHLQHILDAIP